VQHDTCFTYESDAAHVSATGLPLGRDVMSEATTDRALAGNVIEEEVLPPEPTTKAIILGEVVGSFLLSVLGLGIGVSATLWGAPGSPWFADIWPTAAGWALTIALGIYVTATLSG